MDLGTMVNERLVRFDFPGTTKDEVIKGVAELMYDAGKVNDLEAYMKGLLKREKEFTTGIGNGVAIPHCKDDCVIEAAFTLISLKNEIEWEALDNQPVRYIIMLAAPNSSDNVHLKMLSELARKLMDDDFRDGLLNAKNFDDIKQIFKSIKEE